MAAPQGLQSDDSSHVLLEVSERWLASILSDATTCACLLLLNKDKQLINYVSISEVFLTYIIAKLAFVRILPSQTFLIKLDFLCFEFSLVVA